jgi:hypothetical protein
MLAVNERREAVPCVALDPFPDIQHGPAGRVDDHTAKPTQRLEVTHGHSERRQDHDVLRRDIRVVEHGLAVRIVAGGENFDSHLAQPAVHVRVVDDLANEPDATIGELPACLVGVLDRPLHAVAEPEFPGEPNRYATDRERVITRAEQIDQ